MDRRTLFTAGAIVAIALLALVWREVGRPPSSRAGAPAEADPSPTSSRATTTTTTTPGVDAALVRSVRDARLREEMRRRILGETPPQAPEPAAAPRRPDGTLDSAWLDQRMQEDFKPMARACLKELIARDAGTSGRVQLRLTVVGDEKVGGVIDQVDVDEDASTISDDRFRTCLTESMSTLALPPPPHGGTSTIVVPLAVATASAR
jgi:hypothetical protein